MSWTDHIKCRNEYCESSKVCHPQSMFWYCVALWKEQQQQQQNKIFSPNYIELTYRIITLLI